MVWVRETLSSLPPSYWLCGPSADVSLRWCTWVNSLRGHVQYVILSKFSLTHRHVSQVSLLPAGLLQSRSPTVSWFFFHIQSMLESPVQYRICLSLTRGSVFEAVWVPKDNSLITSCQYCLQLSMISYPNGCVMECIWQACRHNVVTWRYPKQYIHKSMIDLAKSDWSENWDGVKHSSHGNQLHDSRLMLSCNLRCAHNVCVKRQVRSTYLIDGMRP